MSTRLETWFVYLVTVEPGPRSAGVKRYLDVSRFKLPIQELNAVGDTVFRSPLGTVVACSADDAFRQAECLWAGRPVG